MFSQGEIGWLGRTVRELYSAQTVGQFASAAIKTAQPQFRLLASACEEVGLGVATYAAHGVHSEVTLPRDYQVYCHDNPLDPLRHAGLPVMQLARQVPRSHWLRTDHFNGIARPMGFNDQLVLIAQADPSLVFIGLYRDRPFRDRERGLLLLLQPHLAAAWRRVRGLEAAGRRLEPLRITLSGALRPLALALTTRRLLRDYFPDWRETDVLPPPLHAWAKASLQNLRLIPYPRPLHAFGVDSARGRLLARLFLDASGDGHALVLVEVPALPRSRELRVMALTEREQQVLHWIAEGKRDAEIALILGIAPATASKHASHVLHKLRVGSRTAAAGVAGREGRP